MILIGPTGPAKITLPQSLTSQHLTKWRRLPKPQKRLNSEYPRSIHPRSALQFAFYILVYNSQASAFLFSADPLSGSHHQLFAFLPPCSVSLCSQAARNRTCQKRPERDPFNPSARPQYAGDQHRDCCAQRLWCPRLDVPGGTHEIRVIFCIINISIARPPLTIHRNVFNVFKYMSVKTAEVPLCQRLVRQSWLSCGRESLCG